MGSGNYNRNNNNINNINIYIDMSEKVNLMTACEQVIILREALQTIKELGECGFCWETANDALVKTNKLNKQ